MHTQKNKKQKIKKTSARLTKQTHIVLKVLGGLAHLLDVLVHGHRRQGGGATAGGGAVGARGAALVVLLQQFLRGDDDVMMVRMVRIKGSRVGFSVVGWTHN